MLLWFYSIFSWGNLCVRSQLNKSKLKLNQQKQKSLTRRTKKGVENVICEFYSSIVYKEREREREKGICCCHRWLLSCFVRFSFKLRWQWIDTLQFYLKKFYLFVLSFNNSPGDMDVKWTGKGTEGAQLWEEEEIQFTREVNRKKATAIRMRSNRNGQIVSVVVAVVTVECLFKSFDLCLRLLFQRMA